MFPRCRKPRWFYDHILIQFLNTIGYTSHLMKRIERGPVRGISLRLQEEVSDSFSIFILQYWSFFLLSQERERKMDFVPERSEIQIANIDAKDPVVKDLIRELGLKALVKAHKPQMGKYDGKKWEGFSKSSQRLQGISKLLHAQIVYW